jgi:uncharacterized protein (DUF1697 family)
VPLHVAFLRGINVGGHRVGRDDLRSCFEEMGFRDVATFRASGNVSFDAEDEPPAEMAARIEAGLAKSLGYEVPAFLRSAAGVRAIADREPFAPELVEASRGKLQVALISAKPSGQARRKVLGLATEEDRLAIDERELYWLPSGGITDSALDIVAIEKLLGPMTIRTKNTVDQIAAKYFARSPEDRGV